MKRVIPFLTLLCLGITAMATEAPKIHEESFQTELSKEWFWGLGTWTAKDGILRGFESGPRRHGPVKMRQFPMTDGIVECDFKLVGKASFAGIIFNGSQERGHIIHLVMSTDTLRILAHPKKGETVELFKQAYALAPDSWHHAKIAFQGNTFTATVEYQTFSVKNAAIGEEKLTFGLGGDSGGPEGEKAGALEFRHLRLKKN